MGLSEPVSGGHVAAVPGSVPLYILPPPHCSSSSPISDPISSSQANPTPIPPPPSSSVPSPDPAPPAASAVIGNPAPAPTSGCGGSPSPSSTVPPPPGHYNPSSVPSSSSALPHPPPPPHHTPHTPLPNFISSSASTPRHQRPSPNSVPQGSVAPPKQLSYAQAAQSSRGPSFVRAHAIEVEPFARIPRTGANIICGSREGMPSFSFVTADLPKVEEIYSNALVMKFLGGRPSLEASHKEISSWGMEKSFSIGPLSSRAFLLRFQDSKDLLKVLTRSSSLLITFPYKVFRWHNLCHLKEDSCLAPVWISLPRLPLQCFIPEFLESVGNKLGHFLCFDRATTTLARPSAARICVELDLRKAPPQFIWIGLFDGFKQSIIYERMPKFCNGCHVLGHTTLECSKSCTEVPAAQAQGRQAKFHKHPPPVRQNATDELMTNPLGGHIQNVTPTTTKTTAPPPPLLSDPSQGQDPIVQSHSLPGHLVHQQQASPHTARQSDTGPSSAATPSSQPPTYDCRHQPASTDSPQELQLIGTQGAPRPIPAAAAPHPPSKSILRKGRNRKKSVTFDLPGQSNLSANRDYWNAVNTQVAILEQKHSILNAATSSASQGEGDPQPPSNAIIHAQSELSSDDSSCSSIAADSPPSSPRARPIHSQPVSYASEGEDCPTEPSPMLGHNTDEILDKMPLNSKKNKRHPDQPLKVQLRVRKDPTPSN